MGWWRDRKERKRLEREQREQELREELRERAAELHDSDGEGLAFAVAELERRVEELEAAVEELENPAWIGIAT